MIPDIRRVQKAEEATPEAEVDSLKTAVASMAPADARAALQAHTEMASARYLKNYRALGDYLLVKYLDGNVKKEKDGTFERTAHGMCASPDFPGYDERHYRAIAKETGNHLKVREIKK